MSVATLCEDCRALGIIATVGGPTCKHQANAGALWWLHNWTHMEPSERIAWLEKNRERKT
jgi:hypothetical protein